MRKALLLFPLLLLSGCLQAVLGRVPTEPITCAEAAAVFDAASGHSSTEREVFAKGLRNRRIRWRIMVREVQLDYFSAGYGITNIVIAECDSMFNNFEQHHRIRLFSPTDPLFGGRPSSEDLAKLRPGQVVIVEALFSGYAGQSVAGDELIEAEAYSYSSP